MVLAYCVLPPSLLPPSRSYILLICPVLFPFCFIGHHEEMVPFHLWILIFLIWRYHFWPQHITTAWFGRNLLFTSFTGFCSYLFHEIMVTQYSLSAWIITLSWKKTASNSWFYFSLPANTCFNHHYHSSFHDLNLKPNITAAGSNDKDNDQK